MSLKTRIAAVLSVFAIVTGVVVSAYTYRRAIAQAKVSARLEAEQLMARTVEMFMVSTRRFEKEFNSTSDRISRQRILDDWNRTIAAVDTAVIHDFGSGTNRVRLIGDLDRVGYKPLGGTAVAVQTPFEAEAIAKLKGGAPLHVVEDEEALRVSAPLWSDAHPGCGQCHVATVEGLGANLNKRVLLGTLNVYIPLAKKRALARSDALARMLPMLGGFGLLVVCVVVYLGRKVVGPVQRITEELVGSAVAVESGASQIAGASQQLAGSASSQASALEETSAATEEVHSMAKKNTAFCREANASMKASQQRLQAAESTLTVAQAAMNDVNESSGKIGKIIRVIDEIAFQTNILALNAAVEAARAGEAGMGFSVVADEVRNLAQRSAQAAKDTAALIEDSIGRSRDGAEKVDQLAEAVRAIAEEATLVDKYVAGINQSSQEQAQGIEQVNATMSSLEQATQSAAASAEESAAAAESLTAQATRLRESVAGLRALIS